MWLYLIRRVAGVLVAMLLVSFAAYLALTYSQGDAAEALIGEHASAEQLAELRRQLRLDAPVLERYGSYMAGALTRGDLGQSLVSGRKVGAMVLERLPLTLVLAAVAILLATVIGFGLGLLAASRHGGYLDVFTMGGTVLGLAVPPYWVALLLVLVFSLHLKWLPVFGSGTLAHLVLPASTLALPGAAMIARLIRSSVLEVKSADFVRTGLAKGLSSRQALIRHILPNSLIPVLTLMGIYFSRLIGGVFVVETIFAWPGLGRLMVQAVFDRDIPVVMGAVLVVVPLCLLINLVMDFLHAILDPRLRYEAL